MEQVIRTSGGLRIGALLNPPAMLANLWRQRELAWQLARRDILGRYRSSWLGLLWSVLTPLVQLAIYTFVFAIVFKSRWGADEHQPESRAFFALTMFCGMLAFNLFAEVVNRAPGLMVDNANYVKRVVFPLETFIVSALITATFNLLVGLVVFFVFSVLALGAPPGLHVLWLPVVLVPLWLLAAGMAWFLASLGVFVRDIGHIVALAMQVLFFVTPIFYSVQRVPKSFRPLLELNPLSAIVENARRVMLGQAYIVTQTPAVASAPVESASAASAPAMHLLAVQPEWFSLGLTTAFAAVAAMMGYAFFMKSKRAFSDVI